MTQQCSPGSTAIYDLRTTLATMKSAKEKGMNMNIWDRDIKAVEDAISLVERLFTAAQGAPMPVKAPGNDQLSKLWNAIVENTEGDGFWIGEILLNEITKETGYSPMALPSAQCGGSK
jgi:hypothetical protein